MELTETGLFGIAAIPEDLRRARSVRSGGLAVRVRTVPSIHSPPLWGVCVRFYLVPLVSLDEAASSLPRGPLGRDRGRWEP